MCVLKQSFFVCYCVRCVRVLCVALVLCVCGILCALVATSEAAPDGSRCVRVVNGTGANIHALYVTPHGQAAWGDEMLKGKVLKHAASQELVFPPRAKSVWWDVRVENGDGVFVEWTSVPLRRFHQVTLLFDGEKPKIMAE